MIQVLITRDDFYCKREEMDVVVNESLDSDELWMDTEWVSIEVALNYLSDRKFREVTINS